MKNKKNILKFNKNKSTIDILDIADSFKSKKVISALKARERFEKEYERC